MFVTMSPSSDNYWETITTLAFGARAASVELGQVQKQFQSGELAQLRETISRLQAQLGATNSSADAAAQVREVQNVLESKDKTLQSLQRQLDETLAELDKLGVSHPTPQRKDEGKRRKDRNGPADELKKQVAEVQRSLGAAESKALASEQRAIQAEETLDEMTNEIYQLREYLAVLESTDVLDEEAGGAGEYGNGDERAAELEDLETEQGAALIPRNSPSAEDSPQPRAFPEVQPTSDTEVLSEDGAE